MIDNKRSPYFTQLLYKIHEIDGIERIRFTSPHPKDFKEETLIAVSELPKIANQIHIPLQSGSDKILSSMHRGYNQKKYLSKIDMIKNIIPDVSLSSDVIVGFPGEDDADFDETMKVAEISKCPVIISGGVSSIDDIKKAKNLKNVEGIIVGKAIYDGDIKLEELVKENA